VSTTILRLGPDLRRALLAVMGALSLSAGVLVLALLPVDAGASTGLIRLDEAWFTPDTGGLAPDFTLPDDEGRAVRLSGLLGAPVVLNFWATWCVPCEVELPELAALAAARPDIHVLAVNVGEDPRMATAWLRERGHRI
jgi:cytochrome c biogenesis protein CcmG, thiol:disulfide interchange protein DsbE